MSIQGISFAYVPLWAKRIMERANAPLSMLIHPNASLDSLFSAKDKNEWALEGCILALLADELTKTTPNSTTVTTSSFNVCSAPAAVMYNSEYVETLAKTKHNEILFGNSAPVLKIAAAIAAIAATIEGYVVGEYTVYYDVYHIADNVYGVTPYLKQNSDKTTNPLTLNNQALTCFMRCVVEILYGHTPKLATVSKTPAFNAWVKGLCSESRYEAS